MKKAYLKRASRVDTLDNSRELEQKVEEQLQLSLSKLETNLTGRFKKEEEQLQISLRKLETNLTHRFKKEEEQLQISLRKLETNLPRRFEEQLQISLHKLETKLTRRFKPCSLARKHAEKLCKKTTKERRNLTDSSSSSPGSFGALESFRFSAVDSHLPVLAALKSLPFSAVEPVSHFPGLAALESFQFSAVEPVSHLTGQNTPSVIFANPLRNNKYPKCRSYVLQNTSADDSKTECFRVISSPVTREKIFNFEVEIIDWGRQGYILIGLTPKDYPQDAAPGWFKGSIGYHADDGRFFVENGRGIQVSSPCEEGDVIGCCANKGRVSFYRLREGHVENVCETRDGEFEFTSVLYPSVALHSGREEIQLTLDIPTQSPDASDSSRDLQCARIKFEGDDKAYKLFYKHNKHNEVGICRGVNPMDNDSYFEVDLLKRGERGCITIGLTTKEYPFNKQPGWSNGSLGFRVFDGKLLQGKERGSTVCGGCKEGDRIGCRITSRRFRSDSWERKTFIVAFVRRRCGQAEELFSATFESESPSAELYPTVGMHSKGEEARIYLPGHAFPEGNNTELRRHENAEGSSDQKLRVHDNSICYVDDGSDGVETWQPDWTGLSERNTVTFVTKIINLGKTSDISIGFGPRDCGDVYHPGWTKDSIAFHARDGLLYHGSSCGRRRLGAPAKAKDVIKAELSRTKEGNSLTIFKNDTNLTPEPLIVSVSDDTPLYPIIGMRSKGAVALFTMQDSSGNGEGKSEEALFSSNSCNIELHKSVAISSGDGHEKGSCQATESKRLYKLEILSMGNEGSIYIGVAEKGFSSSQLPGFVPGSVGYCYKTGELFQSNGRGGKWGQEALQGTIITVEIQDDANSERVVFKRNDNHMRELDTKLRKTSSTGNWHLTVGMISNGEAVRLII